MTLATAPLWAKVLIFVGAWLFAIGFSEFIIRRKL
jgi:hypothetical protein